MSYGHLSWKLLFPPNIIYYKMVSFKATSLESNRHKKWETDEESRIKQSIASGRVNYRQKQLTLGLVEISLTLGLAVFPSIMIPLYLIVDIVDRWWIKFELVGANHHIRHPRYLHYTLFLLTFLGTYQDWYENRELGRWSGDTRWELVGR